MMIFLIEAIMLCLVFTAMVVPSVLKHPEAWASDMPPAVQQRCRELGLIPEEQKGLTPAMILRKAVASLVMALVLALVLVYVNGATRFWEAFLLGYGLWLVVDWYDALVIDCLWFCHDKRAVLPGTEDMVESYHDYRFHIRMSLIGMLLGLPICLLTGLLITILN